MTSIFLRGCHRRSQGLEEARKFCRRFSKLTGPGEAFFLAAIEMETAEQQRASISLPSSSGRASKPAGSRAGGTVQALFDSAVACYGRHSPELWVQYAKYEAGCDRGGGGVYWRATKALSDPDEFILMYRERVQAAEQA